MKKIVLLLGFVLLSGVVHAGGFEFPSNGTAALGRGGAFTARADDLSAIEYNPAGLVKISGTHVYVGNNFSMYNMAFSPLFTYDEGLEEGSMSRYKPVAEEDWQLGAERTNEGGWQLLAPLVGVSTDFGLKDWRFALGIYGPSSYGQAKFEDGAPQKYMLKEESVLMALYTASVAWTPVRNLGFGLSFHWVDMLQAKFAMEVSGYYYDSRIDSDFGQGDFGYLDYQSLDAYDVTANVDVKDRFAWTVTAGAWWRPIRNLEAGLSFRFPTVNLSADGETTLGFSGETIANLYQKGLDSGGTEGLTVFDGTGKATATIPTNMKMKLPPVGRLGVRWVEWKEGREESKELWDIELDVVWEGWSVLKEYAFEMDGYVQLVGAGATDTQQWTLRPISIPKQFKDTWSFRLGGQVAPISWLELRAGGYFETGSVENAYTNLDFASFNRVGLALGFSVLYRFAKLSFSYSHIFQSARDVSMEETKFFRQFPLLSAAPDTIIEGNTDPIRVGAGHYETSYDILSVALSATF